MADKLELDEVMIENMIEMLQIMRQRPAIWIGGLSLDSIRSFMAGFEFALENLGIEANHEARNQEVTQNGIALSSGGVIGNLKEAGMSDKKIIDEILRMELEAWQRRLEKIKKG